MKELIAVSALFLLSLTPLAATQPIERVANDRVTVTELDLLPREAASPCANPGVLVFLQTGYFEIAVSGKPLQKGIARIGEVRYIESGDVVHNPGLSKLHYAQVAFTGPASRETWGTAGLAPHYTLLLENGHTRVYAIRIPAHTNEPQHTHHDRVVICLSGAKLEHLYADGRREPSTLSTGEIAWRRGATHIGQNLGDTDLWVIAVEPK